MLRLAAMAALVVVACKEREPPKRASSEIAPLWRVVLHPTNDYIGWHGIPGTDGRRFYIETDTGVRALDAATGATAWDVKLFEEHGGTASMNVLVAGGGVYLAEPSAVYALSAVDGALCWRVSLPDTVRSSLSHLAADDRALYASARDGTTYALALATGATLWRAPLPAEWRYGGTSVGHAVSGDTVYVAGYHTLDVTTGVRTGLVRALDRATGRELWRWEAPGSHSTAGAWPVVAGDRLLLSDYYGESFFALDRTNGAHLWRDRTDPMYLGAPEPPRVSGDTAFVGANDTYLYAVDVRDGHTLWKAKTFASIFQIALCNHVVLANNTSIVAADRATGRLVEPGATEPVEEDQMPHGFPTSGFAVAGDVAFVVGNQEAMAFRGS